jgi:hypothetical protein
MLIRELSEIHEFIKSIKGNIGSEITTPPTISEDIISVYNAFSTKVKAFFSKYPSNAQLTISTEGILIMTDANTLAYESIHVEEAWINNIYSSIMSNARYEKITVILAYDENVIFECESENIESGNIALHAELYENNYNFYIKIDLEVVGTPNTLIYFGDHFPVNGKFIITEDEESIAMIKSHSGQRFIFPEYIANILEFGKTIIFS